MAAAVVRALLALVIGAAAASLATVGLSWTAQAHAEVTTPEPTASTDPIQEPPVPRPVAVIPDAPAEPLPPVVAAPAARVLPGAGRRVVFDISEQRVWLVEADGTVRHTYRVSGSRYGQLRPGTYSVYSRSARTTSWNSNATMRYMVRFARGPRAAIGFHDIPRYPDGRYAQTEAQLGLPLSDGCIRQALPDARALWQFSPVGTRVVVSR